MRCEIKAEDFYSRKVVSVTCRSWITCGECLRKAMLRLVMVEVGMNSCSGVVLWLEPTQEVV